MHRLLQRQLKRYFDRSGDLPEDFSKLLQAVDQAYYQFDKDRIMLERSLELSSQELLEANLQLRQLLRTVEAQVAERTLELTRANLELEKTLEELQITHSQLIQTEKMSSLGQLVAGIAHEINNPVNFIHANLSHARSYVASLLEMIQLYQGVYPDPNPILEARAEEVDLDFLVEDIPKLFASMRTGSDRICQIVQSLRNFSRMDQAEVKCVDLHEGLESTLMLLQHRLKPYTDRPAIQVVKQYGDLPEVECYAGQLNQVFMNILTNAIDALDEFAGVPADYVRCIEIRTSVVDQQWAEVAIADNGPGICPAVQQRIFDPFFTTKPVGKGTGMGMSISYQIVTEKHCGKLSCTSKPGQGTTFFIQIPIRPSEPEETPEDDLTLEASYAAEVATLVQSERYVG